MDLTTGQSVAGVKTFSGEVIVPAPVNSTDAATKAYVDATSQGLSIKSPVAAATTAALSPANGYASGVPDGQRTASSPSTATRCC